MFWLGAHFGLMEDNIEILHLIFFHCEKKFQFPFSLV